MSEARAASTSAEAAQAQDISKRVAQVGSRRAQLMRERGDETRRVNAERARRGCGGCAGRNIRR